jgi:hypothetical protein
MNIKLSDNPDYNVFVRKMRLKQKTISSLAVELERETGKSRLYCRKLIMWWKHDKLNLTPKRLDKFMRNINSILQ